MYNYHWNDEDGEEEIKIYKIPLTQVPIEIGVALVAPMARFAWYFSKWRQTVSRGLSRGALGRMIRLLNCLLRQAVEASVSSQVVDDCGGDEGLP